MQVNKTKECSAQPLNNLNLEKIITTLALYYYYIYSAAVFHHVH